MSLRIFSCKAWIQDNIYLIDYDMKNANRFPLTLIKTHGMSGNDYNAFVEFLFPCRVYTFHNGSSNELIINNSYENLIEIMNGRRNSVLLGDRKNLEYFILDHELYCSIYLQNDKEIQDRIKQLTRVDEELIELELDPETQQGIADAERILQYKIPENIIIEAYSDRDDMDSETESIIEFCNRN